MRNAREDRPQSKNDARPGGIAARFDHGEAVPRRNGDEGGVADLLRHTTFGAGPTPSEAPKAAGTSHLTMVDAGDAGCILMQLMRTCAGVEELGGAGPQFLCPVRG